LYCATWYSPIDGRIAARYNALVMKAPLAVITLLAIAASLLVWVGSRSSSAPEPSTLTARATVTAPEATPTLAYRVTYVSTKVDGALLAASGHFMGAAPPVLVSRLTSVMYVETTMGQARELADRDDPPAWPDVPGDEPIWYFYAEGEFRYWGMCCGVSDIHHFVGVAMPRDWSGPPVRLGGGSERLDLDELGKPVVLPLSTLLRLCQDSGRPDHEKANNCGLSG
jgi:hypothetical protein